MTYNPRPMSITAPTRKGYVRIAVIDLETETTEHGLTKVFAAGMYDGENHHTVWGKHKECVQAIRDYLKEIAAYDPKTIVYAHNGGRYDFILLAELLDDGAEMVKSGSRIMSARMCGVEVRDSFCAIPFSLRALSDHKDAIDYSIFRDAKKREAHKSEIIDLLKNDLTVLYESMGQFINNFGPVFSSSSASIFELKRIEGEDCYQRSDRYAEQDFFRKFYVGGRAGYVEGKISGENIVPQENTELKWVDHDIYPISGFAFTDHGGWKIYDRVSSYPAAMAAKIHPGSSDFRKDHYSNDDGPRDWRKHVSKILTCDFVRVKLHNPFSMAPFVDISDIHDRRMHWSWKEYVEQTGADYPEADHWYHITGHELRAGIDTQTINILDVDFAIYFNDHCGFPNFVNYWFGKKAEAKLSGNRVDEIFAKLILNSCYGKFGQDPWRFTRTKIVLDEPDDKSPWSVAGTTSCGRYLVQTPFITDRQAKRHMRERGIEPEKDGKAWLYMHNVAIAASIAGAARADLWRAICAARDPVYCDTDSIICRDLDPSIIGSGLGDWKLEAEAESLWIAETKVYVLGVREGRNIKAVKKASAGADLTAEQIADIAEGGTVVYHKALPTLSLTAQPKMSSRKYGKNP